MNVLVVRRARYVEARAEARVGLRWPTRIKEEKASLRWVLSVVSRAVSVSRVLIGSGVGEEGSVRDEFLCEEVVGGAILDGRRAW